MPYCSNHGPYVTTCTWCEEFKAEQAKKASRSTAKTCRQIEYREGMDPRITLQLGDLLTGKYIGKESGDDGDGSVCYQVLVFDDVSVLDADLNLIFKGARLGVVQTYTQYLHSAEHRLEHGRYYEVSPLQPSATEPKAFSFMLDGEEI